MREAAEYFARLGGDNLFERSRRCGLHPPKEGPVLVGAGDEVSVRRVQSLHPGVSALASCLTLIGGMRTSRSRLQRSEILRPSFVGHGPCTVLVPMKRPNPKRSGLLDAAARKAMPSAQFAFPSQRKEPLEDAPHVRNAIARFLQVEGVSDAERDEAWRRIRLGAARFGVEIGGSDWRMLGARSR